MKQISRAIPAVGPNGRNWRKSSRSGAGNDCVSQAQEGDRFFIGDTKKPTVELGFTSTAGAAFLGLLKAGRLELPTAV